MTLSRGPDASAEHPWGGQDPSSAGASQCATRSQPVAVAPYPHLAADAPQRPVAPSHRHVAYQLVSPQRLTQGPYGKLWHNSELIGMFGRRTEGEEACG